MANNKSFVVLIFVLCLNLISTNIYAANVGGWTLGGGVAQGASTVYDATKNVVINGKKFIKESSVKITPPASQVAKVLARGAAGYALSIAVEQLLGAVDWVLDPANNQIVYTDPNNPANPNTQKQVWEFYSSGWYTTNTNNLNTACSIFASQLNKTISSVEYTSGSRTARCRFSDTTSGVISLVNNPAYDPSAEEEKKTLPLDVVAQQVISNAAGGDTAAQQATTAAAADIVAEAETDNTKARPIVSQAEANATTKPADAAEAEKANEAQGEAKPNEANPDATDLSITFPIFCNWAPTICEAAQTVISFPQTLTNWWETGKSKAEEWALSISEAWTAAKEWATKEKDSEDTEVDVEELDLEAESVDINLASGCPAPVVFIDSDFYGQPFKIEFSFDGFCSILSDWVRPILISLGAFIAALILGGVKVNE
jgi:cell pole-organizing protein PopZ